MAIIIGSARIDENGKATGGKKGDQKQTSTTNDQNGEVSMQKFYSHSKGWNILRPKTKLVADKLADCMRKACNNNNIGYSQSDRLGIIQYGTNTITPTNCDCSSLVRRCVIEASGKDPGNFNTTSEATVLENSGIFEKRIPYTTSTTLYTGDVLVTKTQGHTVIVVEGTDREPDGKIKATKYYPIFKGMTNSIVEALMAVGEKDTSLAHRRLIAEANDIKMYNGTVSQNLKMLALLKEGKLIKC